MTTEWEAQCVIFKTEAIGWELDMLLEIWRKIEDFGRRLRMQQCPVDENFMRWSEITLYQILHSVPVGRDSVTERNKWP